MPALPASSSRLEAAAHAQPLQAVIEDARRRARRRRSHYAALAPVLAALAAGVVLLARTGGPDASVVIYGPSSPSPAATALSTAGQLTVIAAPANGGQEPPLSGDGWYGLAAVGRAGRLRYLVRCPERAHWCGEVEGLDWSRDGRWLAVSVTSYGAVNPYNGIHVIDLATGTDLQINGCCDWQDLAWAPDGTKLAYVIGGRIRIINRDGSHDRQLTTGTDGSARDWSPTWSPNGGEIAFATRSSSHKEAAVWIQRPDGTGRRLLASGSSNPAWSPDGRLIAVVSKCGGVKLLTPTGRDVTPGLRRCPVIPVSGIPVWSPSGDRLAVAGDVTRLAPYRYPRTVVYLVDRGGHRMLLTSESGSRSVNGGVDAAWQPPLRTGS